MTEENEINIERFAFDLFANMMLKCKVPSESISSPKSGENVYKFPDFSPVLTKVYAYQVPHRNDWRGMFESRYRSCRFKKFEQVSEFLELALILHEKFVEKRNLQVIGSLALVSELILFLYSQNCRLHLNKLARFWSNYFANLKLDFPNKHLSLLFLPLYLDAKSKTVLHFDDLYRVYPYTFEQNAGVVVKYRFNFSIENPTLCSKDLNSQVPLEISENKEISTTELPENPGLGIRPHEELLLEFYGISANIEKSPQVCDVSSVGHETSASSENNTKFSRSSSAEIHRKHMKERKGLPGLPAMTSRLEQKRQKIRTAYAKRN